MQVCTKKWKRWKNSKINQRRRRKEKKNIPYLTDTQQKAEGRRVLLSGGDTGSWGAKKLYIAFSDRSVNPSFLFMEMDYQPNQWADKVMKYSTMASFPASSI